MTSSFSKKQRQDTVSQTGKRSFSHMSGPEEEPTADNTNISFDLNVQNLMPLIEHLKQQNQQLKLQRDQIQQQMHKLKSISQGVLQENSLMKNHYQQRTEDIRKIVTTMGINMNEQIEDINHMTHITKNHNYGIVKNVEKVKREIQEKTEQIEKIQEELAESAERNSLLQEEMITRNVKIRQMEQKLEELKEIRQSEDNVFKLEDEVDRLMVEVTTVRNNNLKKLKTAQSIQTRNQIQKPQLITQNVNVIQTIKVLTQQLNQLKEDRQSFQSNLSNLRNYHNKVSQKCKKANQERQHQTLQIQSQQHQIKIQKQKILSIKNRQRQRQLKKSQLQDQKYQLQKQLTKRQDRIQKLKQSHYETSQSLTKDFKQKSSKQRAEHNLQLEKNYDELAFKLNPEKQQKQQTVEQLKEEYEELEREVEEMKKTVKNMDNPVKEIIRLEYQLKKLKK